MGVRPGAADVATGSRTGRLDYLRQVENRLGVAARRLGQATTGSGSRFDYPDSEFGQALRWTGNLIETGSPTRVYYFTLGSFATFTSPSFDTHSNQLAVHQVLYSQFGAGLRAFAAHLRAANQFQRVLLLSFSEFGRQVEENGSHGTDHGDASVLIRSRRPRPTRTARRAGRPGPPAPRRAGAQRRLPTDLRQRPREMAVGRLGWHP